MAYYQFYCEHIAEIPPYRRRNQDETGVDLRNVGPNRIRLPAGVSAFPAHDVLYDAPVRGGPHFTVFGLTSVRHLAPPIVWSNPIPGTCGAWDHMQWGLGDVYDTLYDGDVWICDNWRRRVWYPDNLGYLACIFYYLLFFL